MTDAGKPQLPRRLAHELSQVQWLEPWWCFCLDEPEFGRELEQELRKELRDIHLLYPYRASARAIAKREDRDDVLFWLPRGDQAMAIVHLIWKGDRETDESWPRTRLLNSLAEFVERELVPANAEWSGS